MPEGPSIVIAKEFLQELKGKKILHALGNAKIDMDRIINKKIIDLKSWGKHFIISFPEFFIRIHFLMFGTYRLNESKKLPPRLHLGYKNGEVNFYTCSVRMIEGIAEDHYDFTRDVMSDSWSAAKAKRSLAKIPNEKVCDVLLDQELFSGVGNIIKNEVLFRTRIHPGSIVGELPVKKLNEMIREARNYSFDFLEWKKIFQLKKHWLIYKKKECPRCHIPVIKEYFGKGKRLTCYCSNCQMLYAPQLKSMKKIK